MKGNIEDDGDEGFLCATASELRGGHFKCLKPVVLVTTTWVLSWSICSHQVHCSNKRPVIAT